jgi:NTP pyrophosphatase (non-canonical NTP hydrolase)
MLTFEQYQDFCKTTVVYPSMIEIIEERVKKHISNTLHTEISETVLNEFLSTVKEDGILNDNIFYPVLGLAGEVGETCEKIKKIIRDEKGIFEKEDKENLKKELGDILWYVSAVCTELDLNLNDVACENIEKLQSRKNRDKLHGNGDNR